MNESPFQIESKKDALCQINMFTTTTQNSQIKQQSLKEDPVFIHTSFGVSNATV